MHLINDRFRQRRISKDKELVSWIFEKSDNKKNIVNRNRVSFKKLFSIFVHSLISYAWFQRKGHAHVDLI